MSGPEQQQLMERLCLVIKGDAGVLRDVENHLHPLIKLVDNNLELVKCEPWAVVEEGSDSNSDIENEELPLDLLDVSSLAMVLHLRGEVGYKGCHEGRLDNPFHEACYQLSHAPWKPYNGENKFNGKTEMDDVNRYYVLNHGLPLCSVQLTPASHIHVILYVAHHNWTDMVRLYQLLMGQSPDSEISPYSCIFTIQDKAYAIRLEMRQLSQGMVPTRPQCTTLRIATHDLGSLVPLLPNPCHQISSHLWTTLDLDGNSLQLMVDNNSHCESTDWAAYLDTLGPTLELLSLEIQNEAANGIEDIDLSEQYLSSRGHRRRCATPHKPKRKSRRKQVSGTQLESTRIASSAMTNISDTYNAKRKSIFPTLHHSGHNKSCIYDTYHSNCDSDDFSKDIQLKRTVDRWSFNPHICQTKQKCVCPRCHKKGTYSKRSVGLACFGQIMRHRGYSRPDLHNSYLTECQCSTVHPAQKTCRVPDVCMISPEIHSYKSAVYGSKCINGTDLSTGQQSTTCIDSSISDFDGDVSTDTLAEEGIAFQHELFSPQMKHIPEDSSSFSCSATYCRLYHSDEDYGAECYKNLFSYVNDTHQVIGKSMSVQSEVTNVRAVAHSPDSRKSLTLLPCISSENEENKLEQSSQIFNAFPQTSQSTHDKHITKSEKQECNQKQTLDRSNSPPVILAGTFKEEQHLPTDDISNVYWSTYKESTLHSKVRTDNEVPLSSFVENESNYFTSYDSDTVRGLHRNSHDMLANRETVSSGYQSGYQSDCCLPDDVDQWLIYKTSSQPESTGFFI